MAKQAIGPTRTDGEGGERSDAIPCGVSLKITVHEIDMFWLWFGDGDNPFGVEFFLFDVRFYAISTAKGTGVSGFTVLGPTGFFISYQVD